MLKLGLVLFLCGAVANAAYEGPGSKENLHQTLMVRCQQFRALVFEKRLMSEHDRDGLAHCEAIVVAFLGAFKDKGPCDVTPSSYDKVIKMTMKSLGSDKVTLWSGVNYPIQYLKEFAKAIGLYALETGTFLGYMGDGLVFCGQKGGEGINYENCPRWGECENGGDAVGNFWKSISKAFASTAEGKVKILMMGSGKEGWHAYRPGSVLGSVELPMIFTTSRVKSLEPLLVHEPGKPITDNCGTGSMEEMEHLIKQHGIGYTCTNNPPALQAVICKHYPGVPSCQESKEWNNSVEEEGRNGYAIHESNSNGEGFRYY
ncbi:ADP-ribosyl cyclase/cyclic ADP-ribose hydrolase-like [Lineus longissimus]|uniref:ADP-ribosyl cyclase/cyclic ADP-ribose hydrolase-like n=1 Tax=Lineus longissimus TaxID=88925 RepID=UPI002B4DAD0A